MDPNQFVDDATADGGGVLVWADLTKFGRVSNHDLNFVVETMSSVLSKKPTSSIGYIVAPYLASDRVVNAARGERRPLC